MSKPLGPGPGAYRLPTTVGYGGHDPSRPRGPMYSLGCAAPRGPPALGPGPKYRPERVTRDGVLSAPAWSLAPRPAARLPSRAPGPGAHAPERCPGGRGPRAPAYSMGARLGWAAKRVGPAPNAYALRLGPGTPAYSLGARAPAPGPAKSPGPAVYWQREAVWLPRAPQYSLAARLGNAAGAHAKSPGPASYPPNLYNTKKTPYSYSFGTHHAQWAPPMIVQQDTMDCL